MRYWIVEDALILYCKELYDKGYDITGIDYSKRSIEYAENASKSNGRSINYIYEDYLRFNTEDKYDMAMMIYCDFGVLSDMKRRIIQNL